MISLTAVVVCFLVAAVLALAAAVISRPQVPLALVAAAIGFIAIGLLLS